MDDTTRQLQQLKQDNAQYLWHPMAHPGAMKKAAPDIIARGQGCHIWDVDGHRMIDGVGGLWSSNLGHSCREVRDAVVRQMDELPFYNVFRGTTHVRAIELSTRLVKLMAPENVAAVMFSNGGSDAVEGALKVARQYWKLRGQADRYKFISLRQGYHGGALRRHQHQRLAQLPPALRAAAARLRAGGHALAVPQPLHAG